MPFAGTRLDLEIIILSEVNQKEKEKYHMIPLLGGKIQHKEFLLWLSRLRN